MIDNRIVPNRNIIINDLFDILEKFENEQDDLSKRIVLWSDMLFRTAEKLSPAGKLDVEKITRLAQEKLYILTTEVLVNPLNGDLLCDPVVQRKIVWEKWLHSEYKKLFMHCPLDDGEMMAEPPPHLFAKAMLQWVKKLGTFVPERQLSKGSLNPNQMALLDQYPELKLYKYFTFQTTAFTARITETLKRTHDTLNWGLAEGDREVNRVKEMCLEIIATSNESEQGLPGSEQGVLAIQQKIEELESVHNDAYNNLMMHMDNQKKVYEEEVAALEKQMLLQQQTNSSMVGTINTQLEALKSDYRKAIVAMENKIQEIHKANAQAMACLERRLNSIAAERDAAQAKIAGLQASAIQTNNQLLTANQSLQKLQAEVQKLQNDKEGLAATLQYSQKHARRLQQELNDAEDSTFCLIM